MLSPETQAQIARLADEQDRYRPEPSVTEHISDKDIVMVVGVSGAGKNTVMQAASELDPRFRVAGNLTNRSPRPDDDPAVYRYYPHTDAGVHQLMERIHRSELVQYAVNDHSGQIYGSDANCYQAEFNLKDVFSSAVEDFRRIGFRQARAITLVTRAAIWQPWFDTRFPLGHKDRPARQAHAVESLTWSLGQPEDSHYWVENIAGHPKAAGQAIIDIALDRSQGNPSLRALAEACLLAAEEMPL
ncbi:MAG TPA: hypothetical protein VLF59_05945 [Candidatus Saccharimonadales bacterium]|nr:hypothetical protein [Candidatus Saccharimonadales bacterium]